MEFWGVEVKAGQKLKVIPEIGKLIHISQAAMGEVKDAKAPKNIPLRMKTGEQDFVIGSLSAEDRPQLMFDLVFEKEFELSHDLKKGSVFYMGYIADDILSDDEEDFSDSEDLSDEDVPTLLPIETKENGSIKPKSENVKPAAASKPKKEEVKEEVKEDKVAAKIDEEDSDDDEDDSTEFSSDEENALARFTSGDSDISGDDSDEDDEDDSSDEEMPVELPKGKQNNKKRQAESAEKTPAAKKAKQVTPEKSGKKGQNSTPAPAKSAGKTPNMQKQQTPKSGGQPSGKSFNKNFSSGKKGRK